MYTLISDNLQQCGSGFKCSYILACVAVYQPSQQCFSYHFQPCHKSGDPKERQLFVDLSKQLGLHRKPHNLMPSTISSSAVISKGHFIDEQILVYLPRCIAQTVQK